MNLPEELKSVLPAERALIEEPLADHCSFRTGGPASYYLTVHDEGELKGVLSCLKAVGCPYFLIGRGTNLLVGDKGYRGAVIHLAGAFADVKVESGPGAGGVITAGAGATLYAAAKAAAEASLAGMEFASGIPGSLGGALVMNAGAYGGEMKQVVRSVRVMDPEDFSVREYAGEEMRFGYRTSRLKEEGGIALSAQLMLPAGSPEEIAEKMRDLAARRWEKQPLNYPSAGSTFKRPEGYFAGRLIEDAGLRGFAIGGAQVSEKHCGFVINRGGATSKEISSLIAEVQRRVYENSGVRLEREVIYLGEF